MKNNNEKKIILTADAHYGGGNFGIGGGFLVATLGEQGLDIQKHKLPVDLGLVTGK